MLSGNNITEKAYDGGEKKKEKYKSTFWLHSDTAASQT